MRGALAAILAFFAMAPSARAADLLYAVTDSNRLVSFASDSPGSIRSSVPISGALEDENIIGLDLRPATGALYGLGSANRLYQIDTGTGRTTAVGPLFDTSIRGASYGFDFNPGTDRVRVISDAELNMRLNPDDGRVVDHFPESPSIQPDIDLHWAAGDPAAAEGENVSALAYAAGAPTRAFGIDTERDSLVRLDPEDDGVLNTIGPLGLDAGDPNGFDIDAAGVGYAVFSRRPRSAQQDLMTIDLASGRATPAARLSSVGTYVGGRPDPLRALTAVGSVADDRVRPGLVYTLSRTPTVRGLLRGRPLAVLASCSEACRVRAVLRSGRRVVARAAGHVREGAGVVRLRLRLRGRGRRWVRRHPARRLRLQVSARDAAGNVTRTRRGRR